MRNEDTILDEAAAWAVRTEDPSFEEWEAFTLWLEEDPAHAEAYDRVVADVTDAANALPPAASTANDDAGHVRRPGGARLALAGIAAALAILVGIWTLGDGVRTIETAPGEIRMVELDGGGRMELAGGTRITLDDDEPNLVVLDTGDALFTLDGEQEEQFRVVAGGHTFVDIGTVFDARHVGATTSVAVAEGAVLFDPEGESVRIAPGQRLTVEGPNGSHAVSDIPIGQIGEWREGRLTFDDRPLDEVASELSRSTGTSFTVAPNAAEIPISGSLLIDPVRADPQSVGPLLGVSVIQSDGRWVLDTAP